MAMSYLWEEWRKGAGETPIEPFHVTRARALVPPA
jgi:hypothetical protein